MNPYSCIEGGATSIVGACDACDTTDQSDTRCNLAGHFDFADWMCVCSIILELH